MRRRLRRNDETLAGWGCAAVTATSGGVSGAASGGAKPGYNEKKPGTQRSLLARRGKTLGFPGFSKSRNLFQSSRREVAEPSSGTFRGVLHCLGSRAGIYRRFRQSAPSQPSVTSGHRPAFARSQGRWPLSPLWRATPPPAGSGPLAVSP